jgi:hypothetical protein
MAQPKLPDNATTSTSGEVTHVEAPTEDLPGTDHLNPPQTDQQGVKGMGPRSETGSPSESRPGGKER